MKTNKYYVSAITDKGYVGYVFDLDFEIKSEDDIKIVLKMIKKGGNRNPVILFFYKLN